MVLSFYSQTSGMVFDPAFELTEHRKNSMGCFQRGLSELKASSAAIPLDFESAGYPKGEARSAE